MKPRDVILFAVGLLGIAHETVINHSERPSLLLLFAAMVGLPAFLRSDEAARRRDDDGDGGSGGGDA